MRIAIACTGLGHVARGVETWAKDTAAALHARGVAVTLFKGSGRAELPYEQIAHRCIPRNSRRARVLGSLMPTAAWRWGFGSANQIEQTTFAWSLIPALAKEHLNIVHLQDPLLAQTLLRQQAEHGTRIVFMNGTDEPQEFIRQFPYVQEQSPYYHGRHSPLPGQKRFCVPSFVDVNKFSPGPRQAARARFGLPADDFLVLSVGALRKTRKRMDWLVREFQGFNGRLVIAGAREPETPAFVTESRQVLGDRLIVLENVPHNDMLALYQAADVFVLCSLAEIFGLAFVEAMACGIPCLGHKFPVTQWIIGDGGVCVDMEAAGALAHELETLRESANRDELGRRGRQRAVEMFSTAAVVEQMLAMYQEVLAAP